MKSRQFSFDNRLRCALMVVAASTAMSAGTLLAQTPQPALAPPIKVMSFNIRYGKANDGDNRWNKRQALVSETIRMFDPDLLGLQEALPFQCAFLREQFPELDFVGRGREVDADRGEFCAIMFRRQRFEKLAEGHFWLSETPEQPGSKSWDAALPRMVTWVRLRDRDTQTEFIFANTHYDHIGRQARQFSSGIIRNWLEPFSDLPFVLTGDFNSAVGSQPYQRLVQGEGDERPLADTYRVIYPRADSQEGTSSRWSGNREGARIDWIVHSSDFSTLNAAIDYHNDRGRYPSDHYPVRATIRLQK